MGECTRVAVLGAGRAMADLLRRLPDHELDLIAHDGRGLSERRYDLFHICGPGQGTSAALRAVRRARVPVVISFDPAHSKELYRECEVVLSPGATAIRACS